MTTRYPNTACEAHHDVTTSEPICIACLLVEIEFLQQANKTNLKKILTYETEKDSFVQQQSRLWAMCRKIKSALENLLVHVEMIGIAEGFPIEVMLDPDPDPQYPSAFNIKAALIEANAALGRDDQELRTYFPEMFAEKTEPIEKIEQLENK